MRYDVILADPPWQFEYWNRKTSSKRGTGEKYYDVMSVDAIADHSVSSLLNDNAALFLWTSWPFIDQVFKVIKAWGFTYRTLGFIWVKQNPTGFGFFTGMGYYTRRNTEPCLLGVKGSMPVARKDILEIILSPVQKHSRKPHRQYEIIEALYPDARYLELFARNRREGWDVWGNEVESDIEMSVSHGTKE